MPHRRFECLAALCFFLLLLGPVWADPSATAFPATAPVNDWADIETVIVHPPVRGPALWRVARGDAEVWIVGTLGPLPEGLYWNDSLITEKITGAKKLYLEAEASTGIVSVSWFMLTHWGIFSMPSGQKMQDVLAPDVRGRFAQALGVTGEKPDSYDKTKPQVAAWKIEAAFLKKRKFTSGGGLEERLSRIARAKGVKAERMGGYDVMPVLKEYLDLPPAQGQVCLKAALDDMDNWDKHAIAAAQGWAVGDVEAVRAHYAESELENCLARHNAHFDKLEQRSVNDAMAALEKALATPGKSVMLISIGDLLRQQGIVAALVARGYRIEQVSE